MAPASCQRDFAQPLDVNIDITGNCIVEVDSTQGMELPPTDNSNNRCYFPAYLRFLTIRRLLTVLLTLPNSQITIVSTI